MNPPTNEGGFGHGKVILLGEHAVVFGQPALAAGLNLGVRALARPGSGRLSVPAWKVMATAGDGSKIGVALSRLLAEVGGGALDFDVQADIPSRAGLGSSAALAVAVARAAALHTGASAEAVVAAVAASEGVFHGTASGIDAAAAQTGTVGVFTKAAGWKTVSMSRPMKILIGLSGRPRDTQAQVELVGRVVSRSAVARRLVDTLGAISQAGVEAATIGDIDGLGRLFDMAHGVLAGLRVSSPELDALVHGARAAGAIGAKLTGAGGGGAVIALAPSHSNDVLARWKADGFEGLVTEVGGVQ